LAANYKPTEFQQAANTDFCIINARESSAGHICAIVPETGAHQAEWDRRINES